ncbi:MAG: hypothetical protein HKN57_11920 [Xanthomonadales bacterium]|nr:hypothetical protein [Gammaproteobacteria bacterium]MBT8053573.1 hypothetical protein [Gammaproteobacteria bacterium]NND57946.1 hypothetical protein [Xanthomonadales bacterium]NNK50888.1 hypothetical protein [Xanthomonadales bacterium]NNL95274.1 hypothetical protein [Xanthomonadales bacterium]
MNEHDEKPDTQIESLIGQLTIEKAPATLSARLHRIPEEEGRRQRSRGKRRSLLNWGPLPRWALAPAFAAVPLLVLGVIMMQPKQPSAAEIEQARQDLAIAFAYLDKVGYQTGHEIQSILGAELRHSVKEPLSEHMPFTNQSLKEETT